MGELRMIECEICKRRPDGDGITVYRINEKGVPGIWRCEDHLRTLVDPELIRLDRILHGKDPNDKVH